MPRQLARQFINLLWYLAALSIVLAALVVTVGKEILPRINLESDALAQYISQRTNSTVHFSNLRGEWVEMMPEVSADRVSVQTNNLAMTFSDVSLQLDLLGSLTALSPAFGSMHVNHAHIRYTDTTVDNDTEADPEQLWRVIYALLRRNISIHNVEVDIVHAQDNTTHINLEDCRIEQTTAGSKRFFVRLFDESGQRDIYATGSLSGNHLQESSGDLYLHLGDWPLQEWLPPDVLPVPPHWQAWRTAPWHAQGQVWLSWRGTGSADLLADLTLRTSTATPSLPAALGMTLSLQREGDHWQSTLHELTVGDDKPATLLQNVQIEKQNTRWRIQTPALDLSAWQTADAYWPDSPLMPVLRSLHPQGHLRGVDIHWQSDQPWMSSLQLQAQADGISTGPWRGVPAFTGVSGYLASGIQQGFIDVQSHAGFSMHYPIIYKAPLTFDQAQGRVQWHWLPDDKVVLVGSDLARLDGPMGNAHGTFLLRAALPGASSHSELYLDIGLRNSAARYRNHLLPFTLPTGLLDWLHNSIGDADVSEAGFLYRGELSGHEPHSHAVQFFADFTDGDLQFDPHWPRLHKLDGSVLVDDGHTWVHTRRGTLYDTALSAGVVEVQPTDPGLLVNVQATGQGPAADGLKLLRETPLQTVLGNAFDHWQSRSGTLHSQINLQIPLLAASAPASQDVRLQLTDTAVLLEDLRLPIAGLQGELRYQTDTGLTAPSLQARLFNSPVTADIASRVTREGLSITLRGTGQADTLQIAQWSRLAPLQLASGNLDYTATLSLGPFGKTPRPSLGTLSLSSTLENTVIPLPAPMGKSAKERKPTTLDIALQRQGRQDYRLQYGQVASGQFSVRQGTLFNGTLTLGQTAPLAIPNPVASPLHITGRLPAAELDDWLAVVTAYSALPPLGDAHTAYPVFDVTFDALRWNGLVFPETRVGAQHDTDQWRLSFQGARATGSATFPDKSANPAVPTLHFEQLHIDSQPDAAAQADANRFNFANVPTLDIDITDLFYNRMDIGAIRFRLEGTPQSLLFNRLQARGSGYAIKGRVEEADTGQGAQLEWKKTVGGNSDTRFRGVLHMQDEQAVLKHLGVEPPVLGKNIYVDADVHWPGSPLAIGLAELNGTIRTWGEQGKYLQAKQSPIMSALNVVDIATWVRRLRLDFSDLRSDGISFDKYRGEFSLQDGVMAFTEPLSVKSPSTQIEVAGNAFFRTSQLDLLLTATLPVGNNATWIAALAGGLPAAAGVYLVSKVFDNQLQTISSASYTITGPMQNPDIAFKRLLPPKLEAENPIDTKKSRR